MPLPPNHGCRDDLTALRLADGLPTGAMENAALPRRNPAVPHHYSASARRKLAARKIEGSGRRARWALPLGSCACQVTNCHRVPGASGEANEPGHPTGQSLRRKHGRTATLPYRHAPLWPQLSLRRWASPRPAADSADKMRPRCGQGAAAEADMLEDLQRLP
jgi:hypothetical protein